MHRPLAALAVAALVAVSGCSDPRPQQPPRLAPPVQPPAQPPAPVTTTVTPTPTGATLSPTPSTPPLTREQAAKRYLAIVRPYNQTLERLERAINSGEPLPTLKTLAAQVAEANTTRIRQFQETPWPADVRAPVQELVAQARSAMGPLHQAATAKTREELVSLVLRAGRHDGARQAAEIRKRLKLSQYDEEVP
ncbi:hypothetical protein [Carbonactinospora thermoautotrophica]|uniref:hypothetical protein n=1 Tax=Carbonactinospora thermoautotrophica TaxID=1469144 RepID=UPI000AEE24E8|nr:hypothetical protein [Carbonactinospora thermoautotrophica]